MSNTYRKLCSYASSHELSKLHVYFPIVCLLLSCSPFFSNLSALRMEQIKHRRDFLPRLFGSASALLSMCNPHCVPVYFLIIFSSSMSLIFWGGRTLGQERKMQIDLKWQSYNWLYHCNFEQWLTKQSASEDYLFLFPIVFQALFLSLVAQMLNLQLASTIFLVFL